MRFTIQREDFLKPLQLVAGVVERRQTLPVLANVLVVAEDGQLALTGTDLEVELTARIGLAGLAEPGESTLPARKLFDICRNLPEGVAIEVHVGDGRAVVRSGRSRFHLATVPASEFPSIEDLQAAQRFAVAQGLLKALIEHTQFAMAQQDVRYYLNGMLLEVKSDSMRAVATDGHRLAMCEVGTNGDVSDVQVIVPRKGVQELQRLLEGGDIPVEVFVGANHIRVACDAFTFTSKLIDGRFPDYERVLPRGGDKVLLTDRDALRQALLRASVLSNEKYRGVRMLLDDGVLRLLASNPEQEEAEEEIEVNYAGGKLEIGFNVGYLLDVLAVIEQAEIEVTFKDGDSSADIRAGGNPGCRYVVMPMRL